MATLLDQLQRESEDLCGHRGLLAGTDDQTFSMALPIKLRNYYDKIVIPATTMGSAMPTGLLLLSLFTFLAIQEALRLKEEEARAMEKKYGKKRAREEAEKKFQQRIDDFERAEQEQELKDREMVLKNRERMEKAKELADQPIDDSAVVDDMFGFLPNYQNEDTISESQAPSAFRDLPAPKVVQNGDIIPGW